MFGKTPTQFPEASCQQARKELQLAPAALTELDRFSSLIDRGAYGVIRAGSCLQRDVEWNCWASNV